MDGCEFFDKVAAHPDLEWLGARKGAGPETDEVYIGRACAGAKYGLPVEVILDREWDELEAVLTGKRRSSVLIHLTRIVGYFSQVQNWNKSKHAELRDRQKGVYRVPETVHAESALPTRPADRCAAVA